MKTWTLGVCMLIVFAALSQSGRLALEIVLSVVFTAAFFLTLMREVAEKNMEKEADETEDAAKETDAGNEQAEEMPLAA